MRYAKELEKANLTLETQAHELAQTEQLEEGLSSGSWSQEFSSA
jgi:hypothetical protein